MPVESGPEVFNSRGKVMSIRSLPTFVNSRRSTSITRHDLRSIATSLLQDVKTGVPVDLLVSTKLRQLTLSDSSQLTLLLSEILNCALLTDSVEVGVAVVLHFNPRKHFSLSFIDALTTLVVNQCPDHPQLPALLVSLCLHPHLAPVASALSLLVVEKLLCWVTNSTLNVADDLKRVVLAQKLLAGTDDLLVQYAPSGLRLLSKQVWMVGYIIESNSPVLSGASHIAGKPGRADNLPRSPP